MNNDQTNRVNMFKATMAVLDQHNSVWSSMAPLATAVADARTKITAIDTAAQKQEAPTGASANKAAARDALEDVLFLMCEALGALADIGGDNDLLALTKLTRTDIDKFDGACGAVGSDCQED